MTFEEYVKCVSDSIESDRGFKDTDWEVLQEDNETWRQAIDIAGAHLRDERAKITEYRERELDRIKSLPRTRDNALEFNKVKSKADGIESRLISQWERLGVHRTKSHNTGPGDRIVFLHEFMRQSIEGVGIEDLIDLYDEYLSMFGEEDFLDIFEK